MDHAEATATYATDRYLLGELNAAEADAFEEHFFDCVECADDLRIGMRLMNGGRDLARQAAAPVEAPVVRIEERRPRRNAWLPAAVGAMAAALVLLVGAPLLMQQRAEAAPSIDGVTVWAFPLGQSRGEAEVPVLTGPVITLSKDIPLDTPYPRYEARIAGADRNVALRYPLEPRRDGEATSVAVSHLRAGRYDLVIVGLGPAGRETEISRDPFIVRR